jgi:4'-phosphopantetheinyl transferase EntD
MQSHLDRALQTLEARLPTVTFVVRQVTGENECDPAEALFTREMSELRRAQFIAGRAGAHAALAKLHREGFSLLNDSDGAPEWPNGVVGSISHKHLLSIAAVAPAARFRGIGIDLERDESTDDNILLQTIAKQAERHSLELLASKASIGSPGTWLLSAKEAVYKAFFPQFRKPLAWQDIAISIAEDGFQFVPHVRGLTDIRSYGAITSQDGWIMALCWIPV